MDETDEFSESAEPIYHHREPKPFELAEGSVETITRIGDHIERHIGKILTVLHEMVSDRVHVDVNVVAPSKSRNYYTLVTSGMSDRAMRAPAGMEAYRFAELAICLPSNWCMSQEAFQNEDNYWPVRLLKELARLPHIHDSWLWAGHTVQNVPLGPYAPGTKLCAAMLAPAVWFGDGFGELVVNDRKTIYFGGVVPIYLEELNFKLKNSPQALFEKLHGAGLAQVVNPSRENLCK
jgi:hypothetical protein